jgi:hypothetical protein
MDAVITLKAAKLCAVTVLITTRFHEEILASHFWPSSMSGGAHTDKTIKDFPAGPFMTD